MSEGGPATAPGLWSGGEIRAVFERRLRARAQLSGGTPAELDALRAAIMRPEFEPFREELTARIDATCATDWQLAPDGALCFAPAALRNPALAAFHLRFALEFALLAELAPAGRMDTGQVLLRWLLALHAALSYYLQMTASERAAARGGADAALGPVLAAAETRGLLELEPVERCAAVAEFAAALAAGQAAAALPAAGPAALRAACARAVPLLALAHPAERLLTMGGDDRLFVNEDTGLNGYGCSPRPRPWAITFSSSTASSVSEQAFGEVELMRREALCAGLVGDVEARLEALGRETRRAIAATLTLDEREADVVLTASGTDAELIALWLAMGRRPGGAVVNVIVGPDEIGSGSVPAAGGRHFNPLSPLGGAVEPGQMLAGFPSGRIRVEMLPVRDADGEPLTGAAVHATLARLIEEAVGAEETVLLHLVDCSKTGLMAPDLDAVERLVARYPRHVVVVVDAAQMRLSRAMLRHYVEAGFIVLVTGSKFFTGPPFSGGVVIPRRTLATLPSLVTLPPGIAAYATAADFPDVFRDKTDGLPHNCNVGLLARWRAALWEMAAFYAVPPQERRATMAAFEARLRNAIARLPELELIAAPVRERRPGGGWDSLPSIFTFALRRPTPGSAGGTAIGYEDGRRAYHWLNSDIAERLPPDADAEDRALASRCCHTPQPVKLARGRDGWIAGMRIAAGARLVSGVHLDPLLGVTAPERLQAELRDMETVLRKAALIARRWDDFAAPPAAAGGARRTTGPRAGR